MGFQQGLSGLNAASKNLETIGNNVSNSNTVGFKGSQAQFADMYANALNGASALQIGIGTQLARVAQQFTQGNISSSNNALDIAINGNGFFRLDTNGAVSYSRNGQFQLDKDGFIINASGSKLTGYAANANGVVQTATPVPLQIDTSSLPPQATTELDMAVALDSRSTVPTGPALSFGGPFGTTAPDPTSYTKSNSATIYDSLGNPHVLQLYYAKTAAPGGGVWDVFASCDGVAINDDTAIGQLTFDTNGVLDTAATTVPFNLSIDLDSVAGALTTATTTVTNNSTTPLDFALDFTGTTQFGENFSTKTQTQDGFSAGNLSSFSVSADGFVVGRYTNGQSTTLGQVAMANFKNPNGLQNLGNNMWAETATSGQPLVGTPGSGTLGQLQSSAVEDSNVDLTAELVNMITAQRTYQANAQTIKTQDQVLQTLVNLR